MDGRIRRLNLQSVGEAGRLVRSYNFLFICLIKAKPVPQSGNLVLHLIYLLQ